MKKEDQIFKTLEDMMTALRGIKKSEAEDWGLLDSLEDHDGYAYIPACDCNRLMVEEMLKKHKLHIITLCLFDSEEEDEDGNNLTCYSYSTGFHHVNREGWLFCKSIEEALFEETI